MKLIERTDYLNRLKRLKGTPDIKIITGIRRSGKSELLRAYRTYLENTYSNQSSKLYASAKHAQLPNALQQQDNSNNHELNIINIDFNNLNYENLKNYKSLFEYVESRYIPGAYNVLMIDEVQLCPKFELAINSLHNSNKYDIYLTGSNAFLLSSDLATLFSGRFVEIPVFPFSFAEYCEYFEITSNFNDALQKYLQQGGLAGSYVYANQDDAKAYIKNVYTTLVKRDLVDKYAISEVSLLDSICEFLMDNIANLTTANNVSSILKQNQIETTHITVGNYLKYLCNAFMFYKVKRYDIRGKKYLETNEKYYLADTALRYAILGTRNMDYGIAYENIVALELMRRGYTIYVGKLYQKEVDFVAVNASKKLYIQVSDNISDDATLERELSPLKAIKDAYPKILLANTRHDSYDIEGIRVIDIARWLLSAN
ncbi:ATP-binding protein [Gardnerella vaginalis]|uniref:ATP-binding protein n=1 Tax=Gardnerella TaxID=2701 RepID=UPI001573C820|nr:ATP-binding protein [Gardnerella vaginalis]NSX29140.1 ATP-binding protein [Gardnerella vaginalis]